MALLPVNTNNIISDENSKRLENYYTSRKNEFVLKMKTLLDENNNVEGRKEKAKVVLKIITVLDSYSQTWKTYTMRKFYKTVKNKFIEFLDEDEIKKECRDFLDRHFDERCRAYARYGNRCKNKINLNVKGNFCKVHVNFYPKIISILETVLPTELSYKCANLIFTI